MAKHVVLCAALMLMAVASRAQERREHTYTPDNVDNWGLVAGQTARAVQSCPFEVSPQFSLLFEWSKAKHGAEHAREYDKGFKETDSAMVPAKRSAAICDAILAVIGPNGSHTRGVVVPKDIAVLPVEPTSIALKMTAAELLKRVGNNELRLRREAEQADGLLVAGKVENVENGYFGSGPVVTLRAGSFSSIMAYIEKSEEEAAVRLNSGDTVTMLCRNPTNIAKGYSAAVYNCVFQ